MNIKVYLFAALCAALSACDTDLQLSDNQAEGVGDFKTLSVSVLTDKYQTKSVNLSNTIPNGHSIGLFMKNVNESDMVQYDIRNVTFTASATESGQDWTPSKTIYLNEALCDVHAYYPYNEDVTNIEAIPVESTTQTDYMYAGNTIQVNAENRQATLEMEHALSVITLTIKKGTYTGAGNISKVGLRGSGIAKAAKLNGKTGELADITGADEMLCQDVTITMDESGQAIHTLFVPNPVTSNVKISLWVDGNEYYVITPGTLFDQGYRYEYTLTVDEGALDISAVHVGDWGYDQLGNPVLWAGNYQVIFQGDFKHIAFNNLIDENGVITINAIGLRNNIYHKMRPVHVSGDATLTQNTSDFIHTIELTNIQSNIIITFNGLESWSDMSNGVYAIDQYDFPVDYETASTAANGTYNRVALVMNGKVFEIAKVDAGYTRWSATDPMSAAEQAIWSNYYITSLDGSSASNGHLLQPNGSYAGSPNISSDVTTWRAGALAQVDGKNDTKRIIESNLNIASTIIAFNEGENNQGYNDWYLPAEGQLAYIYLNYNKLKVLIEKAGGTIMVTNDDYFSSCVGTSKYIWLVNFRNGHASYLGWVSRNYYVRLVRDLNVDE